MTKRKYHLALILKLKRGTVRLDSDYRKIVLDFLWGNADEGLILSQIYEHVKRKLGEREVSRTAIFFYLNELCEANVLRFQEETCRGGRRKRYFPRKTKEEHERGLVREAVVKLFQSHPGHALGAFIEVLRNERLESDFYRSLPSLFVGRDEITYRALEETLWGLGNPIRP